MSEDFAVNLVIDTIKQVKKKGKVVIKEDLPFRIAITIIMRSANKTTLINKIKRETK
jgi:hypothetical protein